MRPTAIQQTFQLRRPFQPVLVQTDEAMSRLRLARESVLEMVDDGALRWVWDVALQRAEHSDVPARRELRFWVGELQAPVQHAARPVDGVIEELVGRFALRELRAVTVGDILGLQKQQVNRLIKAGELAGRRDGHPMWVARDSLVGFLKRRWVGGLTARALVTGQVG